MEDSKELLMDCRVVAVSTGGKRGIVGTKDNRKGFSAV
jgi:hypothetical protein